MSKKIELVKGVMWKDDLSGICLMKGNSRLVNRGEKDKFSNKNLVNFGVADCEDQSILELSDEIINDKDKMKRINKALDNGILRWFSGKFDKDNKNPENKGMRNLSWDSKKDKLMFTGKDKQYFELLQKGQRDIIPIIATITSPEILEILLKLETDGNNKFGHGRDKVITAIREQLKNKAMGIGGITVDKEDDITLSIPSKK